MAKPEFNPIEALNDYLRGFLRKPGNRELISSRSDWQILAQAELDRRAGAFIASLPDEELRAIASGQAKLGDLADKIV